jgi:IS30 family transposase
MQNGVLIPENELILAFDQGSEFADYKYLKQEKPYKIYYCETHSPWQKGSNENMNVRLRLYLPRETEIDKITLEEFNQLATTMNRCPRKYLGFKTPQELFIQQYKNDCHIWN